jgi:hypothetical protein
MKLGNLFVEIKASTENFNKKINEATSKLDGLSSAANTTNKALSTMGRNLNKNLINPLKHSSMTAIKLNQSLQLAIGTIHMFKSAFNSSIGTIIDASSKTEQYRARMSAFLDTNEKVNKTFEDMQKFATTVPATYEEIMDSATRLMYVMGDQSANFKDKWMPLIVDISSVTGIKVEEVTGQLIRMWSAGAQSADLFRERGVTAMLGFSAGASYSAQQTRIRLLEAIEGGKLGFIGASKVMAKTWDGLISMIQDKLFYFKTKIGNSGFFLYMKAMVKSINDYFDEMLEQGKLDTVAKTISDTLINAFKKVLIYSAKVVDFFKTYNKYFDSGIIGYIFFGKLGAVVAVLIAKLVDSLFGIDLGSAVTDLASKLIDSVKGVFDGVEGKQNDIIKKYGITTIQQLKDVYRDIGEQISKSKAEIQEAYGITDNDFEALVQYNSTGVPTVNSSNAISRVGKQGVDAVGRYVKLVDEQKVVQGLIDKYAQDKEKFNNRLKGLNEQENSTEIQILKWLNKVDEIAKDLEKDKINARGIVDTYARLSKEQEEVNSRIDRYIQDIANTNSKMEVGNTYASQLLTIAKKFHNLMDEFNESFIRPDDAKAIELYGAKLDSYREQYDAILNKLLGIKNQAKQVIDNLVNDVSKEYDDKMKDIDVKLTSLGLSESDAISQEGENLKQSYKDLFAQIRDILISELGYTVEMAESIINSSLKTIEGTIDDYTKKQRRLLAQNKIEELGNTTKDFQSKTAEFKVKYGDKDTLIALQEQLQDYIGNSFSLNSKDVELNAGLFNVADKYKRMREELGSLVVEFPKLGEALKSAELAEIQYVQNTTLTDGMQNKLSAIQGMFSAFHDVFSAIGEQLGQALAESFEKGFDFGAFMANLGKMLRAMAIQKTVTLLFEAAYQQVMSHIYRTLAISNALANPALAEAYLQASIGAQVASSGALAGAAMMGSFATGLVAGMAHDGMKNIPEDGTWLLQKGERVVDSKTNKDLTDYLKNQKQSNINMTVNINGGDEQGVLKALPKLKQTIIEVVSGDIAQNGAIRKTILSYT